MRLNHANSPNLPPLQRMIDYLRKYEADTAWMERLLQTFDPMNAIFIKGYSYKPDRAVEQRYVPMINNDDGLFDTGSATCKLYANGKRGMSFLTVEDRIMMDIEKLDARVLKTQAQIAKKREKMNRPREIKVKIGIDEVDDFRTW